MALIIGSEHKGNALPKSYKAQMLAAYGNNSCIIWGEKISIINECIVWEKKIFSTLQEGAPMWTTGK